MQDKDIRHPGMGKCFGSTTVGAHGQTVIPVEARRELGLETGTKLLAFDFFQGSGLLLIKTDAFEQLIAVMTTRLGELESIAQETTKVATSNKRRVQLK